MNDLIVLAILAEGPKHGYALKKQAGLALGQPDMHNNLVYPLLRRFVAQKWVTQRKTPGERGQTRQVYSLTPLGRNALVDRLRRFDEASSAEAFRLRIGLFELLDPSTRAQILAAREDYLRGRERRLALLQNQMHLGCYGRQVTKFLRQQIRTELAWISRLRRMNGAR